MTPDFSPEPCRVEDASPQYLTGLAKMQWYSTSIQVKSVTFSLNYTQFFNFLFWDKALVGSLSYPGFLPQSPSVLGVQKSTSRPNWKGRLWKQSSFPSPRQRKKQKKSLLGTYCLLIFPIPMEARSLSYWNEVICSPALRGVFNMVHTTSCKKSCTKTNIWKN